MPRRVLIVEPHSAGHRLYYVRLLLDECRSKGETGVILTTHASIASPEWKAHLSGHDAEVLLREPAAFDIESLAAVSIETSADITILPDGDRYLGSILRRGWAGRGGINVLVMRSEVQHKAGFPRLRRAKTTVKRSLIWAAGKRRGVKILVLRSPIHQEKWPLEWVCDPVTLSGSREQAYALRRDMDREGTRYWLGTFGYFGRHKNLDLIAQAILDQPNMGLLIVGTIEPAVLKVVEPLLEQFTVRGGKVVTMLGAVTDMEFDSAIRAVDCVVVACNTEGTSGVTLKAAAAGRRLILSGAQFLQNTARVLGEQAIWSELDITELRHAIAQARRMPPPRTAAELDDTEFRAKLTRSYV